MSEPRTCPNCGAPAPARYCGECGQRQAARLISLRRLLGDVVEDHLSLSGALPRTLGNLLARPGRLTAEYAAGRIARYVAPFRLYLLASLAFFLTLAWTTDLDRLAGSMDVGTEEEAGGRPPAVEGAAVRSAEDDAVAGEAAGAGTQRAEAEAEPAPGEAAGTKASNRASDSASGNASDSASGGARDPASGAAPGPAPAGAERDGGVNVRISFSDTTDIPGWAMPLARRLKRQENRLNAMEPEALAVAMVTGFERNAPKAAFLLLPVFALLLKLLYIRRRRLYVEHFVFALHFHAFAFLAATAMLAVRSGLFSAILSLWILVYLFWAMRRVYRQSWLRTGLKYVLLAGSYWMGLILVLTLGVLFTTLVI